MTGGRAFVRGTPDQPLLWHGWSMLPWYMPISQSLSCMAWLEGGRDRGLFRLFKRSFVEFLVQVRLGLWMVAALSQEWQSEVGVGVEQQEIPRKVRNMELHVELRQAEERVAEAMGRVADIKARIAANDEAAPLRFAEIVSRDVPWVRDRIERAWGMGYRTVFATFGPDGVPGELLDLGDEVAEEHLLDVSKLRTLVDSLLVVFGVVSGQFVYRPRMFRGHLVAAIWFVPTEAMAAGAASAIEKALSAMGRAVPAASGGEHGHCWPVYLPGGEVADKHAQVFPPPA